jgi:hypothetical protein
MLSEQVPVQPAAEQRCGYSFSRQHCPSHSVHPARLAVWLKSAVGELRVHRAKWRLRSITTVSRHRQHA